MGVVLGPRGNGVRADLEDGPDLQPPPEDVQVRSVPDILEPSASALDLPEPSEVEEQIAGTDSLTLKDALVGVCLPEDRLPACLSVHGSHARSSGRPGSPMNRRRPVFPVPNWTSGPTRKK